MTWHRERAVELSERIAAREAEHGPVAVRCASDRVVVTRYLECLDRWERARARRRPGSPPDSAWWAAVSSRAAWWEAMTLVASHYGMGLPRDEP